MTGPPILLHDVEHVGRRLDVLLRDGRVHRIAESIAVPTGALVIDGEGGAVLPGLHDHHLHLMALAASLGSVAVGPPEVRDEAAFETALGGAPVLDDWIRAVGYHEAVTGPLDRWVLDGLVADRPVRVQHRSGGLWVLNSAALERVGLLHGDLPDGAEREVDGTPNGRLFRLDAWLADRLPRRVPDLAAVGQLLASRGVTGVTDATPYRSAAELEPLARAASDGHLPQHVIVTGAPSLDPATVPAPLAVGPAKLLLHDHDPPTPDQVAALVREARSRGRAVAIHCVTRVSLVVTLAALAEVGVVAGDRIEHGAVVPPDQRDELARLGLTVVTQPNFVAERGDEYLAEVEPDDLPHLWPCASLIAAGIPVAAGTDAPFGRPDPWLLVAAAVDRSAPSGRRLGRDERLDALGALDLLLRPGEAAGAPVRRVAVGAPADLCLLDRPLVDALQEPGRVAVRHVVIGGRLVGEPGDRSVSQTPGAAWLP